MDQIPFLILALFLISIALSGIFFVAWWTFDRPKHALTWSITFLLAGCQWAFNLLNGIGFIENFAVYWVGASFFGAAVPFVAVIGYLQRAEKKIPYALIAGLILLATLIPIWFAFGTPHAGLRNGSLPYMTMIASLWAAWVIYNVKRDKRLVEKVAIGFYIALMLVEFALGTISTMQGVERDPMLADLYRSILFTTLPTFFTGLGLIALSVIASDLAIQNKALMADQQARHRAETAKTLGTLQDAIEAIPDLIAMDDGTGKASTCNQAMADFLGMTHEEIIGQPTFKLMGLYWEKFAMIDGEELTSPEAMAAKFWHAIQNGEKVSIATKDDRYFTIGFGFLSSGGQIMIARDVTGIQRERRRLEAAIDALPIGFALFDKNDDLVEFNSGYSNVINAEEDWIRSQNPEAITARFLRNLKDVKSASLVERSIWIDETMTAIKKRKTLSRDVHLSDDTWHSMRIQPVKDGGFVNIAVDITERRLLEMNLEEEEAKLRAVLSTQPFPVIVIRQADCRVLFASTAAHEVLGVEEGALTRRGGADFFIKDSECGKVKNPNTLSPDDGIQDVTLSRANGEKFRALFSSHETTFSGKKARVMSFIDMSRLDGA